MKLRILLSILLRYAFPKLYRNSRQNGIFYTSHRTEIFIIIYAFEITLLDYYHRIMVAVFYR